MSVLYKVYSQAQGLQGDCIGEAIVFSDLRCACTLYGYRMAAYESYTSMLSHLQELYPIKHVWLEMQPGAIHKVNPENKPAQDEAAKSKKPRMGVFKVYSDTHYSDKECIGDAFAFVDGPCVCALYRGVALRFSNYTEMLEKLQSETFCNAVWLEEIELEKLAPDKNTLTIQHWATMLGSPGKLSHSENVGIVERALQKLLVRAARSSSEDPVIEQLKVKVLNLIATTFTAYSALNDAVAEKEHPECWEPKVKAAIEDLRKALLG